jgi:uncharacterized membrane protein YeaQ/YmgE (transglycosylase-associated protein family)
MAETTNVPICNLWASIGLRRGARPTGDIMSMDLIIQLVLGAIGGNIGGALLKEQSLGTLGNSIAGIVGGGIGGQILSAVLGGGGAAAAAGAGGGMLSSIAGGGIGGIVLMAIIGFIKSAMAKK